MTDINTLNAITQERARIREAILAGQGKCLNIETNSFAIGDAPKMVTVNDYVYIRVADVLEIIRNQSNLEQPPTSI